MTFVCWLAGAGVRGAGVRSAGADGGADASRVADVGGKGASLGELLRAGLPVPPGYVVTTAAFCAAIAAIDPSGTVRGSIEALPSDDVAAIARTAAGFRARIAAAPLPGGVASAIAASYRELGESPVAVRSSATMEDSADASFAGLQDTYLGVCGADAVLDAVRRCWASLYNDESVAYRRRLRIGEQDLAMAVVVQPMLRPRAAGVMFTRSPVTGDRSVVAIEGTWGLGSALVAGDVTPDSFTVSKVTGEIVARRIAEKLRMHGPRGASPMPGHLRGEPCLADDEVRALAGVACRVEEHYGVPQDIEWALLGDDPGPAPAAELRVSAAPVADDAAGDRIVLLQSRPETVWAARDPAPVASPKPRAVDHVLAMFGKPL
jgi:pyruvate, water dikinase